MRAILIFLYLLLLSAIAMAQVQLFPRDPFQAYQFVKKQLQESQNLLDFYREWDGGFNEDNHFYKSMFLNVNKAGFPNVSLSCLSQTLELVKGLSTLQGWAFKG